MVAKSTIILRYFSSFGIKEAPSHATDAAGIIANMPSLHDEGSKQVVKEVFFLSDSLPSGLLNSLLGSSFVGHEPQLLRS